MRLLATNILFIILVLFVGCDSGSESDKSIRGTWNAYYYEIDGVPNDINYGYSIIITDEKITPEHYDSEFMPIAGDIEVIAIYDEGIATNDFPVHTWIDYTLDGDRATLSYTVRDIYGTARDIVLSIERD